MAATFEKLWNVTGTQSSGGAAKVVLPGAASYADGSLIPGSNYSAQDDHSGLHIAGL
jgi:hypothetical protein